MDNFGFELKKCLRRALSSFGQTNVNFRRFEMFFFFHEDFNKVLQF